MQDKYVTVFKDMMGNKLNYVIQSEQRPEFYKMLYFLRNIISNLIKNISTELNIGNF